MKQNDAAIDWIVSVLTDQPVALGSCNPPAAANASLAQASPSPFQQIDGYAGTLGMGETAQLTIPCDANSNLQVLASASTASVSIILLDPFSSLVTPTTIESDPPSVLYNIASPAAGNWTLVFDGSALPSGTADYSFAVFGDSNLTLVPNSDVAFLNGEEATISCFFGVIDNVGGLSPAVGPNMRAVVTAPDATYTTLTLYDDGLHLDGAPNDGVFGAVFAGTTQPGEYHIRYVANGTDTLGRSYRRVTNGTFDVSTNVGRVVGNLADQAVDLDLDGFTDVIRLDTWITLSVSGDYAISARLVDDVHQVNLAASTMLTGFPAGTSVVSLSFDCRASGGTGTIGPFGLQDLQLFQQGPGGLAWVDRYRDMYTTSSVAVITPAAPLDDPSGLNKSRFIAFSVMSPSAGETALRVKLTSLHHVDPPYTGGASVPFMLFEGQSLYVGPPVQYVESASSGTPFYAAQLQCAPYYQDWSTITLLHVTGEAIVPSSTYQVENLAASCAGNESSCAAVSAALQIKTTRWGDVEAPFNPPSPDPQPDTSDISALVNKFKSALGAPIKARALLAGGNARGTMGAAEISPDMSFTHISLCVDAFKGLPYPYKPGKCTGDATKACISDADCTNAPNPTTGPCILCP